nr:hypothetical protein [uncultured Fusobacterium sp.]
MNNGIIYWKIFFIALLVLAVLIPNLLILGIYKLFTIIGGM